MKWIILNAVYKNQTNNFCAEMNLRESIYVMNLNLDILSSPRYIYIVNYKLISW